MTDVVRKQLSTPSLAWFMNETLTYMTHQMFRTYALWLVGLARRASRAALSAKAPYLSLANSVHCVSPTVIATANP